MDRAPRMRLADELNHEQEIVKCIRRLLYSFKYLLSALFGGVEAVGRKMGIHFRFPMGILVVLIDMARFP